MTTTIVVIALFFVQIVALYLASRSKYPRALHLNLAVNCLIAIFFGNRVVEFFNSYINFTVMNYLFVFITYYVIVFKEGRGSAIEAIRFMCYGLALLFVMVTPIIYFDLIPLNDPRAEILDNIIETEADFLAIRLMAIVIGLFVQDRLMYLWSAAPPYFRFILSVLIGTTLGSFLFYTLAFPALFGWPLSATVFMTGFLTKIVCIAITFPVVVYIRKFVPESQANVYTYIHKN